jgi:hypothetical protein
VHSRVRRLAAEPGRPALLPFLLPRAANDDFAPAFARRRTAD